MTRSDLNQYERAILFSAHSWYGIMRGKLLCTNAKYAYMQSAFSHFLHDCIKRRAEPQLCSFRKCLERRIPQNPAFFTVRKPMILTQIASSLTKETFIENSPQAIAITKVREADLYRLKQHKERA